MKILPIINDTRHCVAKNINKSLLVAPMLLAISTPEILAKDTFDKTESSKVILTESFDTNYGEELSIDKDSKKVYASEKVQKKIFKLEAKQNKYREKLQEKQNDYKYYNTILKAINGDKKSKKEVLEHVEKKSLKRDLAIFTGTGVAGIALCTVTGPASLLLCISSFFTTNHINNYIVDKKTNPKQKQEVINEIKKIEEDISKINQKLSSIQFKISELE